MISNPTTKNLENTVQNTNNRPNTGKSGSHKSKRIEDIFSWRRLITARHSTKEKHKVFEASLDEISAEMFKHMKEIVL